MERQDKVKEEARALQEAVAEEQAAHKELQEVEDSAAAAAQERADGKQTKARAAKQVLVEDGHRVLKELLLFDELEFDDLKIHQLDALAIALGMEKPPTGKKDVKAAIIRPLFDAHAEQKAAED